VMWLSIARLVKLDRRSASLSVVYICTKCFLEADFLTGFQLCSRIIQLRNRLICSPWLTAPFVSSLSDSSCFKAEHRWMSPPQYFRLSRSTASGFLSIFLERIRICWILIRFRSSDP
jgi:hypothetical protein